jgi:hypothetical protein
MKNVPFDLSIKIMLIADKKECAKIAQFFYESFRLCMFIEGNKQIQQFGMIFG